MSNFDRLGEAMIKKQGLSLDQELTELKNQKKAIDAFFKGKEAELQIKKVQQESVSSEMENTKKLNKIKLDVLKDGMAAGGQGSVAIGNDLLDEMTLPKQETQEVPTDPDAEGLPILGRG